MKRNQYILPPAGSTPLVISATQPSRLVEITEDGAVTSQGFILFFAQDNFTVGYTYLAGKQPAVLGEYKVAAGKGAWVGLPAQIVASDGGPKVLRAASTLCKATSAGGAPTTISVQEYD